MDTIQLTGLFAEIGPIHELDQVSELDGGESWAVVIGDAVVTCELDRARRVLVLSGEIGQPRDEVRARVHETLLQYNRAWPETGGVRMALDGPGGTVIQIYDLSTEGLDPVRLGATIREFAGLARTWRELIGRGPADLERVASGLDPAFLGGSIRA